ncbi:MAG: hypothetical protein JWQ71_2313 [Pedosphaera sp.]|nr:hypothetical protein [Pedosphaera sp.]
MKVLIQDTKSGQFLAPNNGWTNNPMEAENFGFSLTAHSTAQVLNLENYQILFYCTETHYHILIHRSGEGQPADQKV